jgi:hypothetical protein
MKIRKARFSGIMARDHIFLAAIYPSSAIALKYQNDIETLFLLHQHVNSFCEKRIR